MRQKGSEVQFTCDRPEAANFSPSCASCLQGFKHAAVRAQKPESGPKRGTCSNVTSTRAELWAWQEPGRATRCALSHIVICLVVVTCIVLFWMGDKEFLLRVHLNVCWAQAALRVLLLCTFAHWHHSSPARSPIVASILLTFSIERVTSPFHGRHWQLQLISNFCDENFFCCCQKSICQK